MFNFLPLTFADLPFLLEIRNECCDYLHDNRVFSLGECQAWFRATHPTFFIIQVGDKRIGYFRLSNRNVDDRSIYVGADIHQAFRGRGLARPAFDAFLALLHADHDIAVARLEVLSHNSVAQRLYQKLGFRETARRKGVTSRHGALVDSVVMEKYL